MLKNAWGKIMEFHKDESGDIMQTAIIMAILAVIAVGGLTFLGPKIKDAFDNAGDKLDDASSYGY